MKFQCLYRSRMARTKVLEKILLRQIPDGKWVDESEKADGIAMFQAMRKEFQQGDGLDVLIKRHNVQIDYDYRNQCHLIELAKIPASA